MGTRISCHTSRVAPVTVLDAHPSPSIRPPGTPGTPGTPDSASQNHALRRLSISHEWLERARSYDEVSERLRNADGAVMLRALSAVQLRAPSSGSGRQAAEDRIAIAGVRIYTHASARHVTRLPRSHQAAVRRTLATQLWRMARGLHAGAKRTSESYQSSGSPAGSPAGSPPGSPAGSPSGSTGGVRYASSCPALQFAY